MLKYFILVTIVLLSNCASVQSASLRKHLRPLSNEIVAQHDSSLSSKTQNPIADMIVGGLIFLLGFPVLWFNERRY